MPQIGEIRKAKELGYKNCTSKFIRVPCEICGKQRWVQLNKKGMPRSLRCISCTSIGRQHSNETKRKLSEINRGPKNPKWKGGRNKTEHGYIVIKLQPDDFFYSMAAKSGYVLEHRLVMAQHLDRCLQPWEKVHHKDGIKDRNEYSNLKLTVSGRHSKEHSRGYGDGYRQGYLDAQTAVFNPLKLQNDTLLQGMNQVKLQNEELLKQIKLLQWQLKQKEETNARR